jgi:hypothetical protein
MVRASVILILITSVLFSCERITLPDHPLLKFSDDTIYFDTVFSTLGTITKELRVYNQYKRSTIIDQIYLSGGQSSQFRLNIDGNALYSKSNIEIDGGDSIFIFVDIIVNPTNKNSPVAVADSIIFVYNGHLQIVQLLAWGQDIFLIDDETIGTETWHKGKPYLIYNNVTVDSAETLTIEDGVRIFFHRNSSMTIAGSLVVNGSVNSPVLFASDRLEKMYEDVPGQWKGIQILNTSKGNNFNHAIIRNATYGISMGKPLYSSEIPELKLFSTAIMHSSVSGLSAITGKVEAVNCIIAHCGYYCVYIAAGGDFSFTHCTFSNQWEYSIRLTPTLYVSEKPENSSARISTITLKFNNCVIFGDNISEISIDPSSDNLTTNYSFDHCLVKLDTITSLFWEGDEFPGTILNKNPLFIDINKYDFRPDTLSPLINNGNSIFSVFCSSDIRGVSRIADDKPDIGAFERIPGENKKID